MKLVPEDALALAESAFNDSRHLLPAYCNQALLDDSLTGQSLRFYLLLTKLPHLLNVPELEPEQVFWSRYYWFVRYLKLHEAAKGFDVGLEQQAFQILEQPFPECEPDWNQLEGIEELAIRDAEDQLRRLMNPR